MRQVLLVHLPAHGISRSSMDQHTVCAPARDGMQSLLGMNSTVFGSMHLLCCALTGLPIFPEVISQI
jgi:hypothetical protein